MGTGKVKFAAEIWTLCGPRPGTYIQVVSNDIPQDAEVVCAGYDVNSDQIILEFRTEEVPEDEVKWFKGPTFREVKSSVVNRKMNRDRDRRYSQKKGD